MIPKRGNQFSKEIVSDRRGKELRLTKSGEKRLEAARKRWLEGQTRFEAVFGAKRGANLRAMLRAVVASELAPADHRGARSIDE
jgi:DNA-binding MarR family transcriptional regulator